GRGLGDGQLPGGLVECHYICECPAGVDADADVRCGGHGCQRDLLRRRRAMVVPASAADAPTRTPERKLSVGRETRVRRAGRPAVRLGGWGSAVCGSLVMPEATRVAATVGDATPAAPPARTPCGGWGSLTPSGAGTAAARLISTSSTDAKKSLASFFAALASRRWPTDAIAPSGVASAS